jgi:4-hydroxy-4-methyl-2-oxoglutarate aldolase
MMAATPTGPEPLTADELAAYRQFDSVTLFFTLAAIEGAISEDYTGPEIRCMYPEMGPIVGYAVTSEWTTVDAESPDVPFLDYYEWITAQPEPRVVVSMDVDERAGRTASFGDMQARTLRRLGVVGVVTSVGLHKVSAVREAGMPVWTSGVAPAHGSYHLVRYGASVSVGRVTWRTGDLVFADENGAIRIPTQRAREVLQKVQESLGREHSYFDVIDSPDFSVAKLRTWLASHETIYPPVDADMAERWWRKNEHRLAPRSEGIST